MFCYYFSLEAVLQGMAKNNPTEKQTDAEIQATLKHAPVRKLTEGKMQSLSLQTAKIDLNKVTRNNIVWKLARGYCLCYCKTFSLLPDSTECTKNFLPKSTVHYMCHLKSNNIIGQRKTTNTEKHVYL